MFRRKDALCLRETQDILIEQPGKMSSWWKIMSWGFQKTFQVFNTWKVSMHRFVASKVNSLTEERQEEVAETPIWGDEAPEP
jgi:hypothetical protein